MEGGEKGLACSRLKFSGSLVGYEDMGIQRHKVRQDEVTRSSALPGRRSERSRSRGAETHLSLEPHNPQGPGVPSVQGSASHRVLDSGDDTGGVNEELRAIRLPCETRGRQVLGWLWEEGQSLKEPRGLWLGGSSPHWRAEARKGAKAGAQGMHGAPGRPVCWAEAQDLLTCYQDHPDRLSGGPQATERALGSRRMK